MIKHRLTEAWARGEAPRPHEVLQALGSPSQLDREGLRAPALAHPR